MLPDAYDTLEAAEQAARQRAGQEQEWPWTSMYVVESANRERAHHCPDPNKAAHDRAFRDIFFAAFDDPDGRVPEPAERLSAFQPPRPPYGPPAPAALPPAAFMEPVVQQAVDALQEAGFTLVQGDHSAYRPDGPRYGATRAAQERVFAELRRLASVQPVSNDLRWRLLFQSPDDVRCVTQDFDLYQGEGEHDIGDLVIAEFRIEGDIDALFAEVERSPSRQQLRAVRRARGYSEGDDTRRLCRFQQGRVLLTLKLWFPDDEQWNAAVAPLARVAGPSMPWD